MSAKQDSSSSAVAPSCVFVVVNRIAKHDSFSSAIASLQVVVAAEDTRNNGRRTTRRRLLVGDCRLLLVVHERRAMTASVLGAKHLELTLKNLHALI